MSLVSPNFKTVEARDKKFLQWILTQRCCMCGRTGWEDEHGRMQGMMYHHQPRKGHGMRGKKVSDYRAVPLCCYSIRGEGCHEKHDRLGNDTFWADIDVEQIISRNVADYVRQGGKIKEGPCCESELV